MFKKRQKKEISKHHVLWNSCKNEYLKFLLEEYQAQPTDINVSFFALGFIIFSILPLYLSILIHLYDPNMIFFDYRASINNNKECLCFL